LITGVNLEYLGEEWLGFIISKETSASFLSKIGSADPLGENGEFHTLVLECPLFAKSFKVASVEKKSAKGMAYLNVSIV
jgi:diphthine-ammonia ligase